MDYDKLQKDVNNLSVEIIRIKHLIEVLDHKIKILQKCKESDEKTTCHCAKVIST